MRLLFSLALAGLAGGTAAGAQTLDGFGIESGMSSLGSYIGPDHQLNENIRLRVPIYYAGINDVFDIDDTRGEGELNVSSVGLVADYYIWGNGLRVSGGLSFGGYEMAITSPNVRIEGNAYGPGSLAMTQKSNVAPVVAVGYQHDFTRHLGVVAEVGARLTTLEVAGSERLMAQPDFVADLAKVNDDLQDTPILPFFMVGMSWRF